MDGNLRGPAIQGIIVATLTPYTAADEVDPGRVCEHVQFLAERGVSAVAPVGTTGEFLHLTASEKATLVAASVEGAAGTGLKVIAGVWSPRLREIEELCRRAEDAGAHAVFLTTPIYYQYPDDAIVAFYRHVRRATRLPLFCYNIPQYANNEITLDALERMMAEGSVDGIKDSTGKPERLRALLDATAGRIPVYAASDSFALTSRRMGAHGFISALANIYPEAFARIWSGDEAAQAEIDRVRTAVKGYGGISALKYLAKRRGFDFGGTRLPFTELDDAARRAIDVVLAGSSLG